MSGHLARRPLSEWFQGREGGLEIGWLDRFHLAAVVATLGTLTGALGGGFHGRDIIREIALFLEEP